MDIKLFPFQAEDVEKLKSKKSRLVADDPGTGKTYIGIALDQLNREGDGHPQVKVPRNAKTLIVAPKSVMSTWDEHCMRLTDDYVYVLGTSRQPAKEREVFLKDLLDPWKGGYFICNWEALRLLEPKINKKNIVFFHIIADECHKAKNKKSQQTRALKRLATWYKTGLSGTPADNRPHDLWSILNWLWPNYYTSSHAFIRAYLASEKTEEGYTKITGVNPDTIHILRNEMAPWYTRRRKEDVLEDLPPKYYSRVWVDLSPKQRQAYDQMRKTMVAWVQEHREELDHESPLIANAAIAQLTRLQQFADGYMQPKRDADGNIVMRRFWKRDKDTGERYEEWREVWEMQEPSSKLDVLMELLDDRLGHIKETKTWEGEQIVVFSQSKQVIRLLQKRLEAKEIPHGIFTGDVPEEERTAVRHGFQNGSLRVFAGTIKAGSLGLTLTAASTVIFIDREWSPSANGQAEDRTHRIGQQEAVEVIDLIARNTVDLGKKQQLAVKARHLQMLLGDNVDPDFVITELEKNGKPLEIASVLEYTEEEESA